MTSHDLTTFQRENGSIHHNRHNGQRSLSELPAVTGGEQVEDGDTAKGLLEQEMSTYLPHSAEVAQLARQRIRANFANVLTHQLLDDVLLIATELVTNSYRHARPPILLSVSLIHDEAQTVLLEVTDDGTRLETRTPAILPSEENGRGNHIVAALSDTYGTRQRTSAAVTRWAELRGPRNSTDTQRTSTSSRFP